MQDQKNLSLRIGTRGSPLALWQARHVQDLLCAAHGVDQAGRDAVWPLEIFKTTGDRIQDRALNAIGGKGLFTKEIEEALLSGAIDLAVHCVKDMPTECPPGLALVATLEREDPFDAFVSHKAKTLEELPQGAVIGSTSLRRQAQIRAIRPDVKLVTYRGAVETRLRKLADGEVDATLLAVAGLNRLGKEDVISSVMTEDQMVPAVGQGSLTLEIREDDTRALGLVAPLSHEPTEIVTAVERAFLAVLDGSCRTPIAGYARYTEGDSIRFRGRILMPDGTGAQEIEETRAITSREAATEFGTEMGEALKAKAGADFMARLAAAVESASADPTEPPK